MTTSPTTAPETSDALLPSTNQFRVDSCVHYFKDEATGHQYKFNLTNLRKETGTYSDSSVPGLEWNFCQYISGTEYFASYATLDAGLLSLTSDDPKPSSITEYTDPESTLEIELTWENDSAQGSCATSSFTAIVNCSENDTVIENVDASDKCNPIVTMSDSTGCPIDVYKPGQAFSAAWYMVIAFVIVVALLCCVGCICKKLCCKGDEENEEEKKPKEQKEGEKDEEKPGVEMTNNYAGNSMN